MVSADVGILIAKDHEGENFQKALKNAHITTQSVHSGSVGLYLGTFSIKHKERKDHELKCVWTYMNDQGTEVKQFTRIS